MRSVIHRLKSTTNWTRAVGEVPFEVPGYSPGDTVEIDIGNGVIVEITVDSVEPDGTVRFIFAIWGQSEIDNLDANFYDSAWQNVGERVLKDNAVTFWQHDTSTDQPVSTTLTASYSDNTRYIRMANALLRQFPNAKFDVILHANSGKGFTDLFTSDGVWDFNREIAVHDAVVAARGKQPDVALVDWYAAPRTYGNAYGEIIHQLAFGKTIAGDDIGSTPVSIDGRFTADNLLTEIYDWTKTKFAVLEDHRFEPSNEGNIRKCRDSVRFMYANSSEAALTKAPAVKSYQNGRNEPLTDYTHPSPGEGSRRYGEGLMQAALVASKARPSVVPEIDNVYWEPNGSYVEVWSSKGPIRTVDGTPVGMVINGTFYPATITQDNRMRLSSAQLGRNLTNMDTLQVIPESTGLSQISESAEGWKQYPLVRAAWWGQAPPEDAIRVSSKSALVFTLDSYPDGGVDIKVDSDVDLGDLRLDNYDFTEMVTVWSEEVNGARMSQLYLTGNTNLTFRNFHIERPYDAGSNTVIISGCTDVGVIDNTIRSSRYPVEGGDYSTERPDIANGIECVNTNRNITIKGNYIGGMTRCLRAQVNGFLSVLDNLFEDGYDDPVQISQPTEAGTTTEVSGNFFTGILAKGTDVGNPHADLIQFIGSGSASFDWPITIKDNVIFSDKYAQGIFLKDIGNGRYFVVDIQNNLIVLPYAAGEGGQIGNGIKSTNIGDGSIVSGNTCVMLNPTGSETDGPGIVAGDLGSAGTVTVENNIVDKLALQGSATYNESGNAVLGIGGSTIAYDTVFGTGFPNPDNRSFNFAMLRFAGRGDYEGVGADHRNRNTILLDGLPIAADPSDTLLANTLGAPTGSTGSYPIDGTIRLQDNSVHASLTQAYVFEIEGTVDDTTSGYAMLAGDSNQTMYVGVYNGSMRVAVPGHSLSTHSGAYVEGSTQTFRIGVDPAAGKVWVTVNGEPVMEDLAVTPWQWEDIGDGETASRKLRFFERTNGVIGSIDRVRIWQSYAEVGSLPSVDPYKDIDGGNFEADAEASPSFSIIDVA